MARRDRPPGPTLAAVLMTAGCGFIGAGLGVPGAGDGGTDAPAGRDGPASKDSVRPPTVGRDLGGPEAPWEGGVPMLPTIAGCADGTREGFIDPAPWPTIAACSGGWSIPGLLSEEARTPTCGRAAGNHGASPSGDGCSAADLCAEGWHVCQGADEVASRSPTQCRGAASTGPHRFFAVRLGAYPSGACGPGLEGTNNLHGCGSLGPAEDPTCAPLDRRLGFEDCAATDVWRCGDPGEWLLEATVVTKAGPDLGGVLCCRD